MVYSWLKLNIVVPPEPTTKVWLSIVVLAATPVNADPSPTKLVAVTMPANNPPLCWRVIPIPVAGGPICTPVLNVLSPNTSWLVTSSQVTVPAALIFPSTSIDPPI